MKKVFLVVLAIVLVRGLILSGCANSAPAPTPSSPAWEWPAAFKVLSQTGKRVGHTGIPATVWGPLLEKDTGMKVRQAAEAITAMGIKRCVSGEVHIFVVNIEVIAHAMQGTSIFATRDVGPFPVRVIWPCAISGFAVLVRGDSYLKDMHDMKPGVKISVHPGPSPRSGAYALGAWAGLTEDQVDIVTFGSPPAAERAIPEGKVDCKYSPTMTGGILEMEGTPHGIRWLELDPEKDPEGAKRFMEYKPFSVFGSAPTASCPTARGIKVVIAPFCYYGTEESIDTELAYNVAKWLGENFDAYKDGWRSSNDLSIDTFKEILQTSPFPIHSGVIKYLKEKGIWTAKDAKRQAFNVELTDRYVKAYKAALAEADKKGIKVGPANEVWMNLWAEHKKALPRFKVRFEIAPPSKF
ncbi:MAG: hypothetical protein JRJ65_18655 [Deltaproteobacteria bacterium]|nr:hypothetical protein [Deltaproteobacteria bacterium]